MKRTFLAVVAALAVSSAAASAAPSTADVRFATFNASLNRPFNAANPGSGVGLLTAQLADPDVYDQYRNQAKNVAEVIQRIRPTSS